MKNPKTLFFVVFFENVMLTGTNFYRLIASFFVLAYSQLAESNDPDVEVFIEQVAFCSGL